MVVVAQAWRLPGGLSAFSSSVALVRLRTLQVLQKRQRWEGGGLPAGGVFAVVFGGLGVDKIDGDNLDTEFVDVGEAGQGTGGVAVIRGARIPRIRSIDEFVESREDFGGFEGRHIEEAAPDFGAGEAANREARDDTEVVRATFKGPPEVWVG